MANDLHVPAEAALRFQAALGERVQVELFDGLDHLDAARDERLYTAALEWLTISVADAGPSGQQASGRRRGGAHEGGEGGALP